MNFKLNKNFKFQISNLGLAIIFLFLFSKPVWASTTSFGIYPPKIAIVSPPDQTVTVPIKIVNGGDLETFEFSASTITVNDEGVVELTNDKEEATSWLKIENKDLSDAVIKVDAGRESEFNLQAIVPKIALENDHYLALIVSLKNDEVSSTTNSKAIPQIAIPIILSVKEKPQAEKLTVEKFSIPRISLSSEIPVSLRLKNPGKFLVETVGTINQKILPRTPILAGKSALLGKANYTFDTESLGPTLITISIPLTGSQTLTLTQTVLIIPPIVLVLIILIPATTIFFVFKNLKLKIRHTLSKTFIKRSPKSK